jgi:hypothetical protein
LRNPIPPRIDGVRSELEPWTQKAFIPEGVLKHEYYPLEYVIITEMGNDLSYMTTYWDVDRIWKNHIKDRDQYERARAKLLVGEPVILDYSDMDNVEVFIQNHRHISGIHELYKTTIEELRALDREDLEKLLEHGPMKIEELLEKHYTRLGQK